MYVFFLLLAMVALAFFYTKREGMDTAPTDPSAMVQQQQGQITILKAQVDTITLTQSVVDQLQTLSDTNDNNTGTLQESMALGDTASPNAYPDES